MLVQQFYGNPKYAAFLTENFVLYRATRGDKTGDAIYEKYDVRATPTELIVDAEGKEVDWLVGYGPPPDDFRKRLEVTLGGAETYRTLSALYAKNPRDVSVAFKLARKYEDRYSMPEKVKELYEKVVALDPQGKAGTAEIDYPEVTVPYTEYAEFALARTASGGRTGDPAALKAFIAKYPKTELLKAAYQGLASYYGYQAPKDQAATFFAEYTAKFPDDPAVLESAIQRIIRDKEDLDKGLALAEKIRETEGGTIDPRYVQSHAQLLLLKGDKDKADELYGKTFMEGRVSRLAYDLRSYAEFWAGQNANLDSAMAMIEKAVELMPDASYYKQSAATVYIKAGQEDKALAVFGPDFAAANKGDASPLYSYAAFWNRQNKNLESALAAAKEATALEPAYYSLDVLAQLNLKLKNYQPALQAAEQALVLAKEVAAKNPGFPIKQYEDRIRQIKDAQAKDNR